MPYFSRSQLGVILLLGAALLLVYAWRAHWLFSPSPPPPGIMNLAFVEVTGPVEHPGVYFFPAPPSLGDVWQRAGAAGTAPDKDKKIASGSRVEVGPSGGYRLTVMPGTQLLTLGLPIDLNRASAEDLEAVPGIGPALARRIVEYRNTHGPFKQVDELHEKVLGIGQKKAEILKRHVIIGKIN
ncbi:MAG: helix-hairpin-helix domain-containing protein [Desulfobaccales bacterium]